MTLGLVVGMALAVSPARATLVAPASKAIEVRNVGSGNAVVDVRSRAGSWLRIRPAHFALRAGARGVFTVRAGTGARPGDHELLVLLLARPAGSSRIPVRMRLGVRLRVRTPGRLVRHVVVRGLHLRGRAGARVLEITVANAGNVTERLRGATVTIARRGRNISRLRARAFRDVVPGARALIQLRYAGRARGWVTALVAIRLGEMAQPVRHRYRLRL